MVRRRAWLTELSLLVTAIVWGVNFSVVKYATGAFAPLAFNAARVTLGTVVIFMVALAVTRGERWPDRRTTLALLALGTLGNGVYQILFVEGVARTRAGAAALVLAVGPALIALLGRLQGTERITRRGAAGIFLSIVGVGLVMLGGHADPSTRGAADVGLLGTVLVFVAAACWAVYAVRVEPYTQRVNALQLSAITLVGGCVPLLIASARDIAVTVWPASPLAVARAAAATDGLGAGAIALFANPWGAIAYSGLLAIVAAYVLFYRGVRILGPTRASVYSNLQPAVALFVAWVALGEVPSSVQGAGATAILIGIVLTRK